MNLPQLKIVNHTQWPLAYATDGSIGLDLHACETRYIAQDCRAAVDVGIEIEIPDGYGAFIRPRSGLARENGVWCVEGTIDRDYRGRLAALMYNSALNPWGYTVSYGDRIAQLVIVACPRVEIVECAPGTLSPTARGTGGFGSTGR